jgi:hypothetical protein
MNHPMTHPFKASFLLAAATACTQLDAADFNLTWSDTINNTGASATGVIGLDLTAIPSAPNVSGSTPSWITSFTITVTGASSGNGTFTLLDIFGFNFQSSGVNLNYSSELVGQGGTMFMSVGDFSFFSDFGAGAPFSGAPNVVVTDEANGDFLSLTSFTPAPVVPAGVPDIAAWMSSLNGSARLYNAASTLTTLQLEGAHHRPMLSYDRMGKESQAWATGDFGSSSRTRDIHTTTGEAGLNWNAGKSFLLGFAAGHGIQNQDLAFGGAAATKGDYALAELDYRPEGSQWIVSLLGLVGSYESKISRGYANGGSTSFSNGVADSISRAARLRVDAPVVATVGGFGLAPYASYTVTQTIVDAYTETGGAFPASFDEQEHDATEARLGLTASKDLSTATKLLLSVEAIRRFDGAGPALSGQDLTGAVAFSLPGTAPRADCVRFGFDVDHKLDASTLLNVSAHASTVGEAHDVSAAISIRRAF